MNFRQILISNARFKKVKKGPKKVRNNIYSVQLIIRAYKPLNSYIMYQIGCKLLIGASKPHKSYNMYHIWCTTINKSIQAP